MFCEILFMQPLPSFYKVNLFNSISKHKSIFVVFFASSTSEVRSSDFVSLIETIKFPYLILSSSSLQHRSLPKSLLKIALLRFNLSASVLIVSGWKFAEDWLSILLFGYDLRSSIVESTIFDSSQSFYRNIFKKIFLSRLDFCLVPGAPHSQLLKSLNFSGQVIFTYGVGFINKSLHHSEFIPSFITSDSFLFVGRLVEEKNLSALILAFNSMPSCKLYIIGDGPLRSSLEACSSPNIIFLGLKSNDFVHSALAHCGCLVLPSISETWGLVAEEALFYGKPCIISNCCGISCLANSCTNIFVCDSSVESIIYFLLHVFNLFSQPQSYLSDSRSFIDAKDIDQLNAYLQLPPLV